MFNLRIIYAMNKSKEFTKNMLFDTKVNEAW